MPDECPLGSRRLPPRGRAWEGFAARRSLTFGPSAPRLARARVRPSGGRIALSGVVRSGSPGRVRSLRRLLRTLRFAALSDTSLASFDLIAFVSTTNRARAEKFYADALGLHLVHQSSFALVFDAHGTMLRVTVVEQLDPAPNTVLGWAVADISKATRALVARGVVFLRYEGMRQDAQGIWQSPSGAMIAWFTDRTETSFRSHSSESPGAMLPGGAPDASSSTPAKAQTALSLAAARTPPMRGKLGRRSVSATDTQFQAQLAVPGA